MLSLFSFRSQLTLPFPHKVTGPPPVYKRWGGLSFLESVRAALFCEARMTRQSIVRLLFFYSFAD